MTMSQLAGPVVLFMLMTLVGLELTTADFRRVFESPRAVIGGSLAQWFLLPLMTLGVVWAFELPPAFGAGAILVAVSPGAGISNVVTAVGRGNIALSVSLTATASVFAVVTLPLISSLFMGLLLENAQGVHIPVGSLMGQLLVALLVPICLGMGLRRRYPERTIALAPRLQRGSVVVIGIIVILAVIYTPADQRVDPSFEGTAFLAALVWTLLAGGIGIACAILLRLPTDDRFTFFVEFAARNIAVAAIVAMSGLKRLDLTLFSGVYFAVGYPLVIAVAALRRRRIAAISSEA
jgi:BASS family bile acid:Na+ symporter